MTPPEPKFTAFPASRITQKILSKQLDEKDQKDWSAVHEITPIPSSPTPSSRSVADDDTASSATLPPGSPSPPHITHHEPGQSLLKNPETITAEMLNNHMYTAGDPPLDIFVRTSGVERLSDFMLWQAHQDTQIFFLKCLWPEFDLQHWLPVLLEWQWRQKQMDREERPEKKRARKAVKTA
ncbi:hypothetical protein VDGD_06987 [Verticillium dahliae]|nr:hypothetical protein VDGD_06987 [Verticillium dahliae]